MEKKLDEVITGLIILILLNLCMMITVMAIGFNTRDLVLKPTHHNIDVRLKQIDEKLEMFENAIPYDAARLKRIDGEIRGNFNE